MDRFEAMQIFVAVAEAQSFAAAARRRSLSAARVTRAVAALEAQLGARLLHRTTRAVRLTETGAGYLAHCKRILSEVEQAESLASSTYEQLAGALSVTAPVTFGRLHVAPLLSAFLKRHPQVTVRALFADHVLDFFEQNLDVAIRIAHLPDSGLRAIRVGNVRPVVCASPAYLRAHGTPSHPRELPAHALIAFSGQGEPQAWRFQIDGKGERVQGRPRLQVNSADLAVHAACDGHGLTRVLSYQADAALAQRRLRIVLADYEPAPLPVHVLHGEGRHASARVRAFVDFAVASLRRTLSAMEERLRA